MIKKRVYKLFNLIPLFSIVDNSDEKKMYDELSGKFSKEIDKYIDKEALYTEISDRFTNDFNEKLKQYIR